MQLHLDQSGNVNVIVGYSPGQLKLKDRTFDQPVIVTADQLVPWSLESQQDLEVHSLEEVLALKSDLILLGTGTSLRFPKQEVMASVLGHGIGFEVMDTSAACRTYNILVMEGRKVAAALIL